MTDISVSQATRARHVRSPKSANPIRAWAAWLVACEKRVNDARHMRELPDYLLRDIGLARSEIDAAVRCGPRGGR